jgi:microcystin-dependent protein
MSSVRRAIFAPGSTQRPMVGDTKTSMVRVDHIGWLVCDGRSLTRDGYRALFNVIGTEFGEGDVSGSTFNLPDAQGRVMGLIGMSVGNTWVDGDVSGEETHTLTIAEMPAHNHDISGGYLNVSGGVDPSGNGRTSLELTGITLGVSGEHNHGGSTGAAGWAAASHDVAVSLTTTGTADNTGSHDHSISSDGAHTHTVIDPRHRHTIASNGGSQAHNNMQPTLFLGNLFIYCGRITQNITGPDGLSPPASNPSFYPPSTPANRLY